MTAKPLRVLHLEDSADDAALVAVALRDDGVDAQITRVDSRDAFEGELRRADYDLVLADYNLPSFNGVEAQRLVADRCPNVPFIFVSGSLGEEHAIDRVKAGATDYVLKERLNRLAPAVRRAIAEAVERAERRRAHAANLAKSEFLSRMSHDLRTPLNAILGFAQLLIGEESEANRNEYARQILAGGRHLLELINEVLDIARIESGQLSLSAEPVYVSEVAREVLDLIAPLAAAQRVSLTLAPHPCNELPVLADRQRFAQILVNLVSNAVKFNRPGGSVTIRCSERPVKRLRISSAATEAVEPARAGVRRDVVGTILYIEDNQSYVRLMERILGRRPLVKLLHAPSGSEGIAMVRAQQPSAVFLDLHLPDMPGEEVLRRLWEDSALRPIPAAVLSADAQAGQMRRLKASGAAAYLVKPLDIGEVLSLVDKLLGQRSERP